MNTRTKIVRGVAGASVLVLLLLFTLQVWLSTSLSSLPEKSTDAIRVATYNVHYISARSVNGPWSLGDWERRKAPLADAVGVLKADIIGFQEMETFGGRSDAAENLTLEWLLAEHPEYRAGAVGDPDTFPSTQPIFYRHERFTLVDEGWFFFSDTPDVIYSRTFNGSFPAFASWVELRDTQTQQTFTVVNLHTDYASYENRRRSLELVQERITPWLDNDRSVLVVGDFNAWLGSRLHAIVEEVGLTFAPVWSSTYHFDRGWHLFPAIDHVSYSDDFTVDQAPVVLQRQFQNQWPTDHYPVVVDLHLRSE